MLKTLGALMSAFLLSAPQVLRGQTTVSFNPDKTVATTTCVREGDSTVVVSVINMDALASTYLKEYEVHEAKHREQFQRDSSLCPELMALNELIAKKPGSPETNAALGKWVPKLLRMETEAYCVSADIALERGAMPQAVYLDDQELMIGEFRNWLPPATVMAAWYAACGKHLGIGV